MIELPVPSCTACIPLSTTPRAATRVLFLTSGPRTPTTRYRILPYLPHLRRLGFECDVAHSFPEKYDHFRWLGWRGSRWLKQTVRRRHLARAGRYDVIVLEREIFDEPEWELEREFRSQVPRFILDLDDAIFLRYPEKFRELVLMSDQVLAGNPNLFAKCRELNPDVSLLPTTIEPADYPAASSVGSDPPIIGWIGTPSGLDYVREIAPALRAAGPDVRVRVVCDPARTQAALGNLGLNLEVVPWNPRTAHHEISRFTIGIMPLPDGDWERYKCGFKLLQCMACGLPSVASPVGVNADIIQPGVNGLAASTLQEWTSALQQLSSDPALRIRLGAAARESVVRRFALEQHLPTLVQALRGG